jgi:hypothetical protein
MFIKSQGKNRTVNTQFVRDFVIDKYLPKDSTVYTYTVLATYPNGDTAVMTRRNTYEEAQKDIDLIHREMWENVGGMEL